MSLQRLTIVNLYECKGVITLPPSLRHLTLNGGFFHRIEHVVWPSSLETLTIWCLNQQIEGVTWPAVLQQLTIRKGFNQPLRGATWPGR